MIKNQLNLNHKLVVTIVKKGMAKKIVKSAKETGAEGATILFGRGTGIHEKKKFLGIEISPQKEVILTLVDQKILHHVISSIVQAGNLDEPGTGVGFVIDTKKVGGIYHLLKDKINEPSEEEKEEVKDMQDMLENKVAFDLIVSIVNKGYSEQVVDASKKAGAEGGTILSGRGTGIHEHAKLFNISIEPEKEIVLTLINRQKTKEVLEAIMVEAELNKPGNGIAFVLEVEKTVGINHIVNSFLQDQIGPEKV